jgi:hypothetical protein
VQQAQAVQAAAAILLAPVLEAAVHSLDVDLRGRWGRLGAWGDDHGKGVGYRRWSKRAGQNHRQTRWPRQVAGGGGGRLLLAAVPPRPPGGPLTCCTWPSRREAGAGPGMAAHPFCELLRPEQSHRAASASAAAYRTGLCQATSCPGSRAGRFSTVEFIVARANGWPTPWRCSSHTAEGVVKQRLVTPRRDRLAPVLLPALPPAPPRYPARGGGTAAGAGAVVLECVTAVVTEMISEHWMYRRRV